MAKEELTPMMRQFRDLKAKHPDAILLFRCGDFYETYLDDAVTASQVLGITLTCYNGIQGDGCGHCPACKLRREGLERYLSLSEEEKRNLLPSFLIAGIQ